MFLVSFLKHLNTVDGIRNAIENLAQRIFLIKPRFEMFLSSRMVCLSLLIVIVWKNAEPFPPPLHKSQIMFHHYFL